MTIARAIVVTLLLAAAGVARGETLPVIIDVEAQPLAAQAKRVAQALELAGAPLTPEVSKALDLAIGENDPRHRVERIQAVLDPLVLVMVTINAESRVSAVAGPSKPELVQQGWRAFLVKVHNEAGITPPLRVTSPNASPMLRKSTSAASPKPPISSIELENRWMELALFEAQPMTNRLSGLSVEYCIVELYSRDAGKREAKLTFDVGQGTQDLGFRSEINMLFDALPAVPITFDIIDDDGKPTVASLVIRDDLGRVYPARSRRLSPDFFFHDQIYRASGESVLLPAGKFTVTYTRGPEYLEQKREFIVDANSTKPIPLRLKRWINLAEHGWYSGDHHVHAAGCKHYESPTEGVQPADMMRHIRGEDLDVGCVLSWGPCWYHQKQFFEGQISELSTPAHLMRYDVEVSGFPSSHAGHLCLLRLKEDDYPNTKTIDEWPSWDLPVLAWAKKQGAVVGFAHSGWGMQTKDMTLFNFEMPKFDGIGANEYIVDVVHGAVDFISTVDTPAAWELNVWYHTLNCGMTTRISGETDFPCIYGERVGLGRSYVHLGKTLDYDAWADGIRDGRSYVTEGRGHLLDMSVNDLRLGEPGKDGRASVLSIERGDPLRVKLKVAAMLDETLNGEIRKTPLDEKPYWSVERARIGDSRKVPVELVVNGVAVEKIIVEADGRVTDLAFDYIPMRSSWVAVRIPMCAHTNPVFVEVDGKPIRADKRSAQWCLDAVDVCWNSKQGKIRDSERDAASAAYDTARRTYSRILAECEE